MTPIAQEKTEQTIAWLQQADSGFSPKVLFASSFGAEDIVLLDLISKHAPTIGVITLDTGRLFPETYQLMDRCRDHFNLPIRVLFPDAAEVETMVAEGGVNLFYHALAARKQCCAVRKLHPLRKALAQADAWITGVRREQAESRAEMQPVEDDASFGLRKFNPLIEWSEQEVWDHIHRYDLPYNPLHDQFFPSIGCAPCTRSVTAGEDPRSGRWWWEQEESVAECGLHVSLLQPKS